MRWRWEWGEFSITTKVNKTYIALVFKLSIHWWYIAVNEQFRNIIAATLYVSNIHNSFLINIEAFIIILGEGFSPMSSLSLSLFSQNFNDFSGKTYHSYQRYNTQIKKSRSVFPLTFRVGIWLNLYITWCYSFIITLNNTDLNSKEQCFDDIALIYTDGHALWPILLLTTPIRSN